VAGLRIGINALYMIPGQVGGTEIYLRSLVKALAENDPTNQYVLFVNRETGDGLAPGAANFTTEVQPVHAAKRPARILWEQTRLPWRVRALRIDVLLNPGFTAPIICPCPRVTVFHDLQHKRHPEYFRWFDRPFWRFFLYAAARQSENLIAVSDATREDLLRYYSLDGDRVVTVLHGVDPVFFEIGRQRESLAPEPFLLCVSTLHPHKNIERLVRAFARFRTAKPEYRLVLAGMKGFHTGPIERLIGDFGLADWVRITGWIPREDLYDLYRRATGFLYPSTFEGFGMPILEAMAAGIPAACSSIEPLLSIGKGGTLLFAPDDEAAMTAAMDLLAGDSAAREKLVRDGPNRAAAFSWTRTARETLAVLEAAAAQRSRSSS
jgi:glycosyltransferase involved in cell wall biosynthesis